jgi:hypothetical protein
MNPNQLRRSLEHSPLPHTVAGGWWCASGQGGLLIGGVRHPRGSHIPDEIVQAMTPARLALLTANGALQHRLDAMPADLPQPVEIQPDDDAAINQRIADNMKAAGVLPSRDLKVGSRGLLPQAHPSTLTKEGKGDVS